LKYICLVYHEEKTFEEISEEALAEVITECGLWVEELEKGGHHVFSAALQSVRSAQTLRERGQVLQTTDGPFAETKEYLGGFTIIDAKDAEEAARLAAGCPAARIGTVEVRPVFEYDGPLSDPLDQKIAAAIRRSAAGFAHR